MIFCNAGTIATGIYLGSDTVGSALDAFIKAVVDLTGLGKDLILDFKFCKISIKNRDFKYIFSRDFIFGVN